MEKHRCKLCYRKFSNGRALGGHMRSHMMNLHVPTKPESRRSYDSFSSSSSSGSESEPEEGEIVREDRVILRRRSRKLGRFGLHDKGSDTETSKTVTRRTSSRTRRLSSSILPRGNENSKLLRQFDDVYSDEGFGQRKMDDNVGAAVAAADEQLQQQFGSSSISEVTSEEDVAFCLMMMSRDTWTSSWHGHGHEFSKINNEEEDDDNASVVNVSLSSQRKKYKCETCDRVFKSYQALGGHRASHKKTRVTVLENGGGKDGDHHNVAAALVAKEEEKKIHECPVCFRVFASGQALGGHKRSHVTATGTGVIESNNNRIQSRVLVQSPKKLKNSIDDEVLIDLNLPAPVDDDYNDEFTNQIDTSVVSDVHL